MRPLDPATTIGLSSDRFMLAPNTAARCAIHARSTTAASVAAVSTRLLITLTLLCGLAILAAFAFQVLVR